MREPTPLRPAAARSSHPVFDGTRPHVFINPNEKHRQGPSHHRLLYNMAQA